MLILAGKMTPMLITDLNKRNVIYIRKVRVKHLEWTLGYMGKFFNNGSMTTILKVQEGLGGHATDGRCALSMNEEIRRFVGK